MNRVPSGMAPRPLVAAGLLRLQSTHDRTGLHGLSCSGQPDQYTREPANPWIANPRGPLFGRKVLPGLLCAPEHHAATPYSYEQQAKTYADQQRANMCAKTKKV